MYCPNCGKEVSEESKFCKHCGFKIGSLTNESEVETNNQSNQIPEGMEKVVNPELGLFSTIGRILGVVGLIGGVYTIGGAIGGGIGGAVGYLLYLGTIKLGSMIEGLDMYVLAPKREEEKKKSNMGKILLWGGIAFAVIILFIIILSALSPTSSNP